MVIFGHGAGGHKGSDYVDAILHPWVKHGVGATVIDLPLHGERMNGKLTPRILSTLSLKAEISDLDRSLLVSLVRQASNDFHGVLETVICAGFADPGKTVFAGFSLGAILGTAFCAGEPRIRRAALALGGGGFGWPFVDPADLVGKIAPRPLLFVNATRDEIIPRKSAESIHEAARNPKRISWYDCQHSQLPGAALREIWEFLRESLR